MVVVPKRRYDGELIFIPAPAGVLVVECEVTTPKSSEGRTVYVHIDAESVVPVMKALREQAISVRQKHEGSE